MIPNFGDGSEKCATDIAVQTILYPCGKTVSIVYKVCYEQGSVDQLDKNSAHHTFAVKCHHCDLVIFVFRKES